MVLTKMSEHSVTARSTTQSLPWSVRAHDSRERNILSIKRKFSFIWYGVQLYLCFLRWSTVFNWRFARSEFKRKWGHKKRQLVELFFLFFVFVSLTNVEINFTTEIWYSVNVLRRVYIFFFSNSFGMQIASFCALVMLHTDWLTAMPIF